MVLIYGIFPGCLKDALLPLAAYQSSMMIKWWPLQEHIPQVSSLFFPLISILLEATKGKTRTTAKYKKIILD
jgi:hypothetical protein